jgi:predicted glycoside hydrolase/deacetylase ChbG (UPF0249 family)
MDRQRCLIVNADDFGQSPGVNRGVIDAHERGIVTSASLMVRWPAAPEAAEYARQHPELSVGLHFEVGEWAFREGEWTAVYEVVRSEDRSAVELELERQLEGFQRLVGRPPTHLDSHQHVHLRGTVRPAAERLARDLEIPLRCCSPFIQYNGTFYGQTDDGLQVPGAISVTALIGTLEALPWGWTELACHPGRGNDLDTMYGLEREREVAVLCDSTVRDALSRLRINLRSFREI